MKRLFCVNGEPCVNRVLGTLGYIICAVALFIPSISADEYSVFLWTSTGLLLGNKALEKFGKSTTTKGE